MKEEIKTVFINYLHLKLELVYNALLLSVIVIAR